MGDAVLAAPAAATRLADGVALQRGVRSPGEGVGCHAHDYHAVTVLLSSPGQSMWCVGGESRSGRPAAGDVFVCPAHVPLSVRSEKPCECVLLCLSPAFLSRVGDHIGNERVGDIAPAVMRRDLFVHQVVTALAEEAGCGTTAGGQLLAASLATALGIHLIRKYTGTAAPDKPVARLSDEEVARLRSYIDRHLGASLTLAGLAALVGRSQFHFARLFKASVGITARQYVVRRRVERAGELLRAGGVIAEVAAAVGFASQSHLHAHVRRAFGCTPGQLARRLPGT